MLLLNDGKEAWKYLEESACDLVVMDVPSWGEEGADASVVKSSDSSVLQATIKDLLAKRSMRMKEKNKKGATQR